MKSESGEESKEYGVFSRKLIVVAVLVGISLMVVGQLVVIWWGWEDTETMRRWGWEDTETMRTLYKTSRTLLGLGMMISSGVLIAGGVINKSIDKFVRLGMLVAAALIIMQLTTWAAIPYFPRVFP
jgi:hypothetical protein